MREPRLDEPTETFGNYVLYECLGRGGMATVHRAKKTGIEGFERAIALKRMLPWLSADAEFVKSFVREARLAAQLRHTNIAQTYDLGKADGVYYIAMELVAGRDLREVLRHAHNVVGPPPANVIINLLFQICDALDYAHTFRDDQGRPLGLVHRDISPANIIVGDDGTAKIVDFGVAKGTTNTLATQSGMLKGKFSYMAPEMLQGQVDARSDLFAVGVVAWELLTARPLFAGGDDMEILQRIAGWDPPPPSSLNPRVPTDLDAWLAMALAKDPRRRFQSAAQMRAGLELVARTPAMRASAADVAGWFEWAFEQTRPARRPSGSQPPSDAPSEPAVQVLVSVLPDAPIDSRSKTLAVDDSAIEVEILRRQTSVGLAPMPIRHAPSQAHAIPGPIVIPPSGAVPIAAASPTIVPAAPTQIMMPDSEPAYAQPQAYPVHAPAHAQPTRGFVLPDLPPGAGPVPLSAIAPTISPDAGYVVPPPAVAHPAMTPKPALHGGDLRSQPEYIAATAAYQAAGDEPLARGTPHFQAAAEEPRRSRPRSAAQPVAPPRRSPVGTVLILILCAAAGVGGFFLVQHLM
jgi:serine/threonine protein kinase